MQIQKTNNTSFQAIKLASAEAVLKNNVNKFNIYRLTSEDKAYVEHLRDTIDLKTLMPNIKEEHYKLWNQILGMGLDASNQTLLLTKDNKACGALRYKKSFGDYYIQAQVTWPVEPGKREPFAGKTLMMTLFKLFMQDSSRAIKACVVRNNPFDTVSKCMEMGFSSNGGDNFNELMSVSRARVEKVLEKFKDIIKIEELSSEDNEILY